MKCFNAIMRVCFRTPPTGLIPLACVQEKHENDVLVRGTEKKEKKGARARLKTTKPFNEEAQFTMTATSRWPLLANMSSL